MKKILLVFIFMLAFLNVFSQETDSITDSRDGRVYRVVKIGEQWWMQENLNIGNRIQSNQAPSDNGSIEKYCYNNLDSLCNIYGGLYRWDEMMDYNTTDAGNPGKTRGICPSGWHIPTDEEWKELEMHLGMSQAEAGLVNVWRGTGVGTSLRAGGSSGYEALYCGRCSSSGSFSLGDEYEYVWTATDYGSDAWRRCLSKYADDVGRWNTFPKTYAFSVRCIKDNCMNENLSTDIKQVKIYPNPFDHSTTIRFPNAERNEYQLRIYNLAGKPVKTIHNITVEEVELGRKGMAPGLYLFELKGGQVYRGKLVLD